MEDTILGYTNQRAISFAEFFNDFKTRNEDICDIPITDSKICKFLRMEDDQNAFLSIAASCSLDLLSSTGHNVDESNTNKITKYQPPDNISSAISDEPVTVAYTPGEHNYFRMRNDIVNPENIELKTFKSFTEIKNSKSMATFGRTEMNFKQTKLINKSVDKQSCDYYNDILVSVRVYRQARGVFIGRSLEKSVFEEEFKCLGSNLLTDLRDKIYCICNKKRFFDISDNPDSEICEKTTDPAYFFIHDTFYNDKRNPDNPDYSETIRDWLKRATMRKKIHIKYASMEKTHFFDLTARLGYPYLYMHHGNCEHIFAFSQLSILTPKLLGNLYKNCFPYRTSLNIFNNRVCHMCGQRKYTFIVYNSARQLHNPAYVCRNCFHSFNYINGKKIGHFKAYRIYDNDIYDELDENDGENNDAGDGGNYVGDVDDNDVCDVDDDNDVIVDACVEDNDDGIEMASTNAL